MKTATKKPRGYQYTVHREDCICLPCRCKRGEIAESTKTVLTVRIEKTMKEELMDLSEATKFPVSTIVEEAIKAFLITIK